MPLANLAQSFIKRYLLDSEKLTIILMGFVFTIVSTIHRVQVANELDFYPFFSSLAIPKVFSNLSAWIPLSSLVSQGYLFPLSAQGGEIVQGLSIFPYLSLWINGFFIFIFGLKYSFIVQNVIYSFLTFLILYKIFRKYISNLWSLALTVLSLGCFADYPFRQFLLSIFKSDILIGQAPMELSLVPFPSLSILCFFAALLFSLRRAQFKTFDITMGTLMWALQSQIHLYNALIGLCLWFFILHQKLRNNPQKYKILTGQLAVAFIAFIPWLVGYINMRSFIGADRVPFELRGLTDFSNLWGLFYGMAYFVFPLLFINIIFVIKKVDPYEIYKKFGHIYFLLGLEIAIVLIDQTLFSGYYTYEFFSRLFVFLHFFYLLPVIYFLERPIQISSQHGIESTHLASFTQRFLNYLMTKGTHFILPIVIFLNVFFVYRSGLNQSEQIVMTKDGLSKMTADYRLLTGQIAPQEKVISDDVAINTLTSAYNLKSTLLAHQFINRIPTIEAIERFALFAKIYNYSQEEFISLMAEGPLDTHQLREASPPSSSSYRNLGVGHFFSLHLWRMIGKKPGENFNQKLIEIYNRIDILEALKKFNIARIHSRWGVHDLIKEFKSVKANLGEIYYLKE